MAEDKQVDKEAAPGNEASPEEALAKSKKKRVILIAAALCVVALGGGGAAFFLLSGGEKKAVEDVGETMAATEAESPQPEESEKAGEEAGKKTAEESVKKADAAEKAEGAAKSDKDKKPTAAGDLGETYALKTFNLNLGNPLENHYVRLEVSFEYTGGDEQKSELEKRMPRIRDAIVGIVSRKTREFLLAPDGKHQLRKEIFQGVNRFMTKPIAAVYITDLLIE